MSSITAVKGIAGLEGWRYLLISRGSDIDTGAMLSSPLLTVDVEATGVDITKDRPIGVGLCPDPTYACYLACEHAPKNIITDSSRSIIAHNATYDRSMLMKLGIKVDNFIDTMVAAHMLGRQPLNLQYLASAELGMDLPPHPSNMAEASFEEVGEMCCKHTLATRMLWDHYEPELKKFKLDKSFHEIEMPLVPIISDMEIHGALVDIPELERLGRRFQSRMDIILGSLHDVAEKPLNPNSSKQVREYLFEELGLPPPKRKTKGGEYSTDSKLLTPLKGKHPSVGLILAYRQYRKLKSDYADGLVEAAIDDHVHTSFNQCGTRTGRWSSSGPNLQNIPMRREEGRQIRKAFIAPEGCMLVRPDWDQLELRVLAHYCQDAEMLRVFRSGEDIHENTAVSVFGSAKERRPAKNLNFMAVYMGGAEKASEISGMSYSDAVKWMGKYFETYPGIERWWGEVRNSAREAGYVRTFGGRIRYIPELFEVESARIREAGEREAVNTIIQGSAADIVKAGTIRCYKELRGFKTKLILQVHDELVFEVPNNELKDVIDILKCTLPSNEMSVPLTVSIEVGPNWRDTEKIV